MTAPPGPGRRPRRRPRAALSAAQPAAQVAQVALQQLALHLVQVVAAAHQDELQAPCLLADLLPGTQAKGKGEGKRGGGLMSGGGACMELTAWRGEWKGEASMQPTPPQAQQPTTTRRLAWA